MYDVTPQVRGHWHALLQLAAVAPDVPIECIDHAAPAPLTDLWAREDLAAVFMCGYPLATRYPRRPPAGRAGHGHRRRRFARRTGPCGSCARSSAFDTLASTFGHRIGWTVEHSYSGFIAPRHALLAHATATRQQLYRESVGPLGHPRGALAALADARIDVTAVDAYWWWLLQRHDPATGRRDFARSARPLAAPMPPLVCAAAFPDESARRLISALLALHEEPEAKPHLDALGIRRFAAVTREDYALARPRGLLPAGGFGMLAGPSSS